MTEAKDTVETTQTPAEEVKTETVETQEQPVKVEPNPLLKKIEVSVSKEELDKDIMARLKRYAKKAKFHGFRPGHAPMHMVAATYGAEAEQEAINDKAIAAAAKALDEGKFAVAGRPSIYPVEGQDQNAPEIKFAVEFEVYPDVTIPELKNVKVTEFECELSDEDVQKTLDVMLKQRTEYKKIDRVAQDGDLVDIDFEGKLNGEVFQGGKADHYKFILGEGRMLPAFEEAIRGMAAG